MRPKSELPVEILRPLTEDELQELIRLYKNKGERYHCMSIYNNYRWSRLLRDNNNNGKWKRLQKKYYTHRQGNLLKNGTYISLQYDVMLSIQFHTLEESLQELKECLVETNLIDWKSGPLFTGINENFTDEMEKLLTSLGGVVEYEIPCTCFVLARSSALKIQVPSVPEGYELRPLQETHADFIHSNWPHNEEASVDFIREMIAFNITLGIFRLRDDELIAWIFQNEFFGLGILQVIPEEQRKGFGKLLSLAMSKEIAKCDENDITSFAVVHNISSENILKKIGFEKDCVTKWIQLKKF